jgi:hypothetical protein
LVFFDFDDEREARALFSARKKKTTP